MKRVIFISFNFNGSQTNKISSFFNFTCSVYPILSTVYFNYSSNIRFGLRKKYLYVHQEEQDTLNSLYIDKWKMTIIEGFTKHYNQ